MAAHEPEQATPDDARRAPAPPRTLSTTLAVAVGAALLAVGYLHAPLGSGARMLAVAWGFPAGTILPLVALVVRAVGLLPLGERATRLAALSSVATGVSAALVHRAVERTTRGALPSAGRAAASIAGLAGAAFYLCDAAVLRAGTEAQAGPLADVACALSVDLIALAATAAAGRRARSLAAAALLSAGAAALVDPAALGLAVPLLLSLVARGTREVRAFDRSAAASPWLRAGVAVPATVAIAVAFARTGTWDLTVAWAALLPALARFGARVGLPIALLALAGAATTARRSRLLAATLSGLALARLLDGGTPTIAAATLAGLGVAALARAVIFASPALAVAGRNSPARSLALPSGAAIAAAAIALAPALLGRPARAIERGLGGVAVARAALAMAGSRALVVEGGAARGSARRGADGDDAEPLAELLEYEQSVGARPDVTILPADILMAPRLLSARAARGGNAAVSGEQATAWAALGDRARSRQREPFLAQLVARDSAARDVLAFAPDAEARGLEPLRAATGVAVSADVPLFRLGASRAPPPPARVLADRIEALLPVPGAASARALAAELLAALAAATLSEGKDLSADARRAAALATRALALVPADAGGANEDPCGPGADAARDLAVASAQTISAGAARDLCAQLLARCAGDVRARLLHADLSLRVGDAETAARDFAAAGRKRPDSPAPLVGLARVARLRDDREAARALVDEALALDPGDVAARALLADLDAD